MKSALKKFTWKTLVAAGLFGGGYATRYYVDRDVFETKKELNAYCTKKDSIDAHYAAELDKEYHNLDLQNAANNRKEADKTQARIDSLEHAQENTLDREARTALKNMQKLHSYANGHGGR